MKYNLPSTSISDSREDYEITAKSVRNIKIKSVFHYEHTLDTFSLVLNIVPYSSSGYLAHSRIKRQPIPEYPLKASKSLPYACKPPL